MSKDQIFQIIRDQLLALLPELDPARIVPEASMRDLGANSIDRADVIIGSLEALGLKIPLHELGALKNLGQLVDFYFARLNPAHA